MAVLRPPIRHTGAGISFQPRIRKGAFFEAAWRYGCRQFSVYNRTYITGCFGDAIEEYWQVVQHVALWPAMGERQIEISGADAADFVNYLTPRDMTACAVGQCKYALITAADGGILGDPIILRLEDNRFWLSSADGDLELWARGVALHSGFEVRIRDAEVAVMQIQGPKSPLLLRDLFGPEVLSLKYYWHMPVQFHGVSLVLSRTGWSGEVGYELYLADADKGDTLFDALMRVGAPYSVAPGAVSQARRIEAGILSAGVDMTHQDTPYTIGLGRLVEHDNKTDFIGKAALKKASGVIPEHRLVGLSIKGPPMASNEDVWPLYAGGRHVGELTSLAYSPRLECNIALARVHTSVATMGTELSFTAYDGPQTGTVTDLPFTRKRQADAVLSSIE